MKKEVHNYISGAKRGLSYRDAIKPVHIYFINGTLIMIIFQFLNSDWRMKLRIINSIFFLFLAIYSGEEPLDD